MYNINVKIPYNDINTALIDFLRESLQERNIDIHNQNENEKSFDSEFIFS